jgi:DNA-binding NarL/FixJ family response regulator
MRSNSSRSAASAIYSKTAYSKSASSSPPPNASPKEDLLDPKVVASLVSTRGDQGPLAQLTERERDVPELMAEGLTNAGIAKRLYLSERTVGAHVRHLLMNSMCPKARTATAASSPCSRT